MSHVLRFEDVVELGFGQQIFFEDEFVNAAAGDKSFLGYGGALFVAEYRIERSNETSKPTTSTSKPTAPHRPSPTPPLRAPIASAPTMTRNSRISLQSIQFPSWEHSTTSKARKA